MAASSVEPPPPPFFFFFFFWGGGGEGRGSAGLSTAWGEGVLFHEHQLRAAGMASVMTPAGLEPAIPGSVGRCLIHWATGPLALVLEWWWEHGVCRA